MMHATRLLKLAATCAAVALLAACATPKPYDYTAFKQAKPKSILVLPPVNKSPDVKASYSFLSWTSFPIGEAGYYVFPVAMVDETFRQNGLVSPDEIAGVSHAKLREIFGADAALYIEITDYGTRYMVFSSVTRVTANARLIDLRTGTTLWNGAATASNDEGNNNNSGGGLVGMLVTAAVKQIVNTVGEQGHPIAGITSQRLLAPRPDGLLYGPHAPNYGKDDAPQR